MKGSFQVGFVLVGSAVCFCYAPFFVDLFAGKVIQAAFSSASPAEQRLLIPAPTRFASDHQWVFMLALALICAAAAMACHFGGRALRCLVSGLGGQALVFWVGMFCQCYDGFCGGSSIHHGPSFEVGQFLTCGFGVFPITLTAIVLPSFAVLRSSTTWPFGTSCTS